MKAVHRVNLRSVAVNSLAATVHYGGFAPLLRAQQRSKIPVLAYHSVTSPSGGDISCLELAGATVDIGLFRRQMEYIALHYTTVGLEEVVGCRLGRNSLPKNPCVLTFDDGYADAYENAYPILKRLSLKATFFVIGKPMVSTDVPWLYAVYRILDSVDPMECAAVLAAGAPGFPADEKFDKARLRAWFLQQLRHLNRKSRYDLLDMLHARLDKQDIESGPKFMTPIQVGKLGQEGFEIGCHSVEHEVLSRLSDQELKLEIDGSRAIIEKVTGQEPQSFCYPFGGINTWNERVVEAVKQGNFLSACTTVPGLNAHDTDLYALRRTDMSGTAPMSRFVLKLHGGDLWLRQLTKIMRRHGGSSNGDTGNYEK